MASRLSQDPIERLFGIVRQMLGCNDHPTPTQFLISVNCLAFQNLAKSESHRNVSTRPLNSLIGCEDIKKTKSQNRIDQLLDVGDLSEANEMLKECGIEHTSLITQASDSRLIFYIGSYVAKKCIASTKCEDCCRHRRPYQCSWQRRSSIAITKPKCLCDVP